jgi:hypothetical protein
MLHVMHALDTVPWVLAAAMFGLLLGVIGLVLRIGWRLGNELLASARAERDQAMATYRVQMESAGEQQTAALAAYTDALSKLAAATATYIAGDAALPQSTADRPRLYSPAELADIEHRLRSGIDIPDDEPYVDWTDGIEGLEGSADARARFIPVGMNPVDLIKRAAGEP